jgi:riboflavin synthase
MVMFTGIVQEVGSVEDIDPGEEGTRLAISAKLAADLREGDSVSVEGACLTATAVRADGFDADVMNQTLSLTTLGELAGGARVNLEPALRAGEPLGGHIVQGHVDGVGSVRSISEPVWIDAPADVLRYCVEKGSITVDGVSLTVAALDDSGFAVALVPHTLAATTLGAAKPGDAVNLEVDVLAKYVERLTMGR